MGNNSSKSKGQVLSQGGPSHTKGPEDLEPPYPGPSAEYSFVNTEVMMSAKIQLFSHSMMTSNVDAYYPHLAQAYTQGYRLLSFYHIPGQVRKAGGFFSLDVLMPFQGIFCRYPSAPHHEQYSLRIEKSLIHPQIKWNGLLTHAQTHTDSQHLCQTIANNTVGGGRLVCIELTGQQHTTGGFGMNAQMPVLGCDLFFEIPINGGPGYVYNVVSAPLIQNVHVGFKSSSTAHCDWASIMGGQLSQGWKLVEVFLDQGTRQTGFTSIEMNTQWFFEKPEAAMNDFAPRYQSTVVEHWIKMTAGMRGMKTHANWEPTIQNMGNKGWELACILETPEINMEGFSTQNMKCMLFFQRPMPYTLSYPAPPQGAYPAPPQGAYPAPPQGAYPAPPQGAYPGPPQEAYPAPPYHQNPGEGGQEGE